MASLNREAEVPTSTSQAGGLDEVAGAETSSGREISRRGEEARGGFVLRAKSDDVPQRRRSLVERSGMKSIVQVSSKKKFFLTPHSATGYSIYGTLIERIFLEILMIFSNFRPKNHNFGPFP